MSSKSQGFTLIELLVVIAVIGLIASVAQYAVNNARIKARDAKRLQDVKQMQTALALFFTNNNAYPDDLGEVPDMAAGALGGVQLNTIMSSWPVAPVYAGISCNIGAIGNNYRYNGLDEAGSVIVADDPPNYFVRFCLDMASGGISAGIHFAYPNGIQ